MDIVRERKKRGTMLIIIDACGREKKQRKAFESILLGNNQCRSKERRISRCSSV